MSAPTQQALNGAVFTVHRAQAAGFANIFLRVRPADGGPLARPDDVAVAVFQFGAAADAVIFPKRLLRPEVCCIPVDLARVGEPVPLACIFRGPGPYYGLAENTTLVVERQRPEASRTRFRAYLVPAAGGRVVPVRPDAAHAPIDLTGDDYFEPFRRRIVPDRTLPSAYVFYGSAVCDPAAPSVEEKVEVLIPRPRGESPKVDALVLGGLHYVRRVGPTFRGHANVHQHYARHGPKHIGPGWIGE